MGDDDSWLYPRRLLLRVRGPLLRRRLDRAVVADGLAQVLGTAVVLPPDGEVLLEHVGPADWRARLRVTTSGGSVRLLSVEVGAAWSEPPPGPGLGEEVRALLRPLLALAATVGADVDVVEAVPRELDAPRPRGRLTAPRCEQVLGAVGL